MNLLRKAIRCAVIGLSITAGNLFAQTGINQPGNPPIQTEVLQSGKDTAEMFLQFLRLKHFSVTALQRL